MQLSTDPTRADPQVVPDLARLTRADLDALPADHIEALRRVATVVRHPVGDARILDRPRLHSLHEPHPAGDAHHR